MNQDQNNDPSHGILPITTAGTRPAGFGGELVFDRPRVTAALLIVFLVIGFSLRVGSLGSESFGEDELNKLDTVNEYRNNGLSGKNGEHPFLMKGLQLASLTAADRSNSLLGTSFNDEAALRFPIALFGTFSALLIFLLISALFGRSIGLVAGILWSVEPLAVGFDRVAKEDGLVLFFFLLTNLLWVRGMTAAERGDRHWYRWSWAAGAGFAALMASKYYPHLLAVPAGFYNAFAHVPGKKWNLGKPRWLKFILIMGAAFLIFNPTILLPDTWHEMLKFSSENRIGHDSYEFMGALYTNKMSAWLAGVPWTFYYVFIAVKTSITTLVLFVMGIPLLVRKRMGDGRFLLFFWAFMWFLPFTFLGGKFMRYFTLVEPLLLISAAVAVCWIAVSISRAMNGRVKETGILQACFLAVVVAVPLYNSLMVGPNFRLFTNIVGGGKEKAGSYFPHDEFYDAATRQTVERLAASAPDGSAAACETPALFEHYAKLAGRDDIRFVSLSDKQSVAALAPGDSVIVARGRRYFSNTNYVEALAASVPTDEITLGDVPAVKIYKLDGSSALIVRSLAR